MLRVGHLFDKPLGENVYGSRLRRNGRDEINPMALGSFKPYLKPFRDWRDGAIKAMRCMADKKDVIALTADVSSFYHQLNPDFMLNTSFHQKANIEQLDEHATRLSQLFIGALQAWAKLTPLQKGLPWVCRPQRWLRMPP